MRVRVPIDKNSSANDHVHRILKLFKKFNAKNNKYQNEINNVDGSDDDDDDDGGNNGDNSHEDEMSDAEILGVSSPNHPCINEELVQKQTCGLRNKPCEYELYGMPRM
jgi:hypothetical protein